MEWIGFLISAGAPTILFTIIMTAIKKHNAEAEKRDEARTKEAEERSQKNYQRLCVDMKDSDSIALLAVTTAKALKRKDLVNGDLDSALKIYAMAHAEKQNFYTGMCANQINLDMDL